MVQVEQIQFALVYQSHTLVAEVAEQEALVVPVPVDQVVGEQVLHHQVLQLPVLMDWVEAVVVLVTRERKAEVVTE